MTVFRIHSSFLLQKSRQPPNKVIAGTTHGLSYSSSAQCSSLPPPSWLPSLSKRDPRSLPRALQLLEGLQGRELQGRELQGRELQGPAPYTEIQDALTSLTLTSSLDDSSSVRFSTNHSGADPRGRWGGGGSWGSGHPLLGHPQI